MTFGKQKPLSSENKPSRGDKVRVKGSKLDGYYSYESCC